MGQITRAEHAAEVLPITGKKADDYRRLIRDTLTRPEQLAAALRLDEPELARVHGEFPLRINPYYLSLIEKPGDPIWKQAVPPYGRRD